MTKQSASKIGHNSQVSGERIKAFVDRVEKLEDQKSFIGREIKDVFAEAKGQGFDSPTLKKLVAERKIPEEKLNQQFEMLDLYRAAIGTI